MPQPIPGNRLLDPTLGIGKLHGITHGDREQPTHDIGTAVIDESLDILKSIAKASRYKQTRYNHEDFFNRWKNR